MGWIVKYLEALTTKGNFRVVPDVYWIPISKLKAKYGTSEPEGIPENLK